MKRVLLSIICCSPLLFSPAVSFSVDLVGPSETPQSLEQYGPVNNVETLWAISTKLRPDTSVSVQQTMVALYKLNPFAFRNGNINKIIPTSMLTVPSLDYVLQQSNQEAQALIKKFSRKQTARAVTTVKAKPVATPKPTPKVEPAAVPAQLETQSVAQQLDIVNPSAVASNGESSQSADAAENTLSTTEARIQALEAEVLTVTEQYIVATEVSQTLKLKIQPLNDQIEVLAEQIDAEKSVQEKLQRVIDDLQSQLDNTPPAPFAGEGMLDSLLRFITASATTLLLVILSPIILLLLIYAFISRSQAKRELAEHEQELAESTAVSMEENGQFESLLTEEFDQQEMHPIDLADPKAGLLSEQDVAIDDEVTLTAFPSETEQTTELPLQTMPELTPIDDVELTPMLEPETVPAEGTETDTQVSEADDPFGIGALSEDETLIAAIDSDAQGETQLAESSTASLSSDVQEDVERNHEDDDPFGINELSLDDLAMDSPFVSEPVVESAENESNDTDAAQQADLDLAAAWESQILASEQTPQEESLATPEDSAPDIALAEFDLSALAEDTTSQPVEQDNSNTSPDIEALEMAPSESEPKLTDAQDQRELAIETPEITPIDLDIEAIELAQQDNATVATDQPSSVDMPDIAPLEIEPIELADIAANNDNDLLAQQISDVAFNEQVELPKVGDSPASDDFIDIETLLGNSEANENDEPYSELALDLGLEEFPDVVNMQESVDIDDDEHGIAAQLDLARAYLEIDDKAGAKNILLSIADLSDGKQRVEIDKLLSRLG